VHLLGKIVVEAVDFGLSVFEMMLAFERRQPTPLTLGFARRTGRRRRCASLSSCVTGGIRPESCGNCVSVTNLLNG